MLDYYRTFLKPLVLYLGLAVGGYLAFKLVRHVRYNYWVRTNPEYAKIPHFPLHWLLGNLINLGKRLDPSLGRHPDYSFEEIWNELGRPPCFWMDMSPIGFAVLVNADPGLAEAVTEPRPGLKYSTIKSDTLNSLRRLLGWDSMILTHGEEWRSLRRRFNKGFAPSHLHSLAPLILDRTQIFIARLKGLAQTGEDFLLSNLSMDLTTDIITVVALDRDFGAQTMPEGTGEKSRFGIFSTSQALREQAFKTGQPNLLEAIDPVRPFMGWLNETILNWRLYNIVSEQLAQPSSTSEKKPSRSITSLATADLPPTPALIKNTVSQLKSFLFAGQDTTATLIQWLCFELSKCTSITSSDPQYQHYRTIHKALIDEHNAVFGASDPFSALTALADPLTSEATINTSLPVTNAWIKETLRLRPPAATARMIPFESPSTPPFTLPLPTNADGTTTDAKINGLRIYNCSYLIHRDPRTWGPDAHVFNPSRWLDESYIRSLPTGAWRPFERGPRNCIGQTLATLEAVVVLSAVARGLSFQKRGRNTTGLNGERDVHAVYSVTAVPADGMRMRVRLAAD